MINLKIKIFITSDACIENIVVVVTGISIGLIQAAKERDEEIVGFVDESEGSGNVTNCPAEIITNEF